MTEDPPDDSVDPEVGIDELVDVLSLQSDAIEQIAARLDAPTDEPDSTDTSPLANSESRGCY
jgi:hypothetical protein